MESGLFEDELFQSAYLAFIAKYKIQEPCPTYPLSYEFCKIVENCNWLKNTIAKDIISYELREILNLLNFWSKTLTNWGLWVDVVESYNEDDAWLIRDHFVEPICFFCMFQPSATRDRFCSIATNAIHQVNLSVDENYQDWLEIQDSQDEPNKPLFRNKSEKQLNLLGKKWKSFNFFKGKLRKIDSSQYRTITQNYRNKASHYFAPRFEIGYTDIVRRTIANKIELVKQPNNTYLEKENPEYKVPSYSYGGIPPLSLKKMYAKNCIEYNFSIEVLNAYQCLLRELLE